MIFKKFILVFAAAVLYGAVFGAANVNALSYGEEFIGSKFVPQVTVSDEFSDVPSTHWAYESINFCRGKGYLNGYLNGKFMPEGSILRAEAIKVLDVFLGLDISLYNTVSFDDVDSSKWYWKYVEAGQTLLPVRNSKKFYPEIAITREDAIYALVTALHYDRFIYDVGYSQLFSFNDGNSVSPENQAYVAVALEYGIIEGYKDNSIKPKETVTRAEFAALLHRGEIKLKY